MDLAVSSERLRREFGEFVAVDDIDLAVPAGSFYGFLGLNGAGKSTTIKCLTGLMRPSAGSMHILGLDAVRDSIAVRRRIGVVPENLALFDRLTGVENLVFVGRAYELEPEVVRERTESLLGVMELEGAAGKLVADYSHGMRKKLALACALLPNPQLLFLDEPFEGVDAGASRHLRRLLQRFVQRGGTVFLTSHVLTIVEQLCDHVGIIHRGRLVAQGPVEELGSEDAVQGGSLEDLFLERVGVAAADDTLEWLAG